MRPVSLRSSRQSRLVVSTALLSTLVTAPLSAQTWQAIGTPNNSNSGAYWNNASADNVGTGVCNVGAILTNNPNATTALCNNGGAASLPSSSPLTSSNVFLGGAGGSNPGGFRFAGGTYSISLFGRTSSGTPSWGVITDAGTVISAAALAAGPVTIAGPFAVYVTPELPVSSAGTSYLSSQQFGTGAINARASTLLQQFAVFMNGTGVGALGGLTTDAFGTIINSTNAGASYFVGIETNLNGGRGFGTALAGTDASDRDYNDLMIRIQATSVVPEPSSVLLLGAGLAGLALAGRTSARRRRLAASGR